MLHINFSPFPALETERLILRRLIPADRQQVFEIRSDAATMQYIPRPIAKTLEDADAVIAMINGFVDTNERINWAITEKGQDMVLGIIGYVNVKPESHRAEVGYVLHKQHLRRGLSYEALQAVLQYGFDVMNLHSVEAIICTDNAASQKMIEKAGFVREACFKDYIFHNDRYWDEYVYSLIRPSGRFSTF